MNENLRCEEASQYLSVAVSTLWLYCRQGKIHPVKLSKRVTIFKKSDLDAFIASMSEAV
ncbi:MAG: helix-turn-helix domain-containing protein [Sulfuricurvum sp.]|nr:helix-turn-helix domain-containing protein [Sulfuricurvum sp.]